MSDYIIHQRMDLHKSFFNFYSYDGRTGRSAEGRVHKNDQAQVSKYLDMFDAPAQVAVEATRGWYWFVDALPSAYGRCASHLLDTGEADQRCPRDTQV